VVLCSPSGSKLTASCKLIEVRGCLESVALRSDISDVSNVLRFVNKSKAKVFIVQETLKLNASERIKFFFNCESDFKHLNHIIISQTSKNVIAEEIKVKIVNFFCSTFLLSFE